MKYSTKTLLAWLAPLVLLSACSAPAPKPVVTQEAETPKEQLRIEAASAEFSKALKSMADKKYDQAEEQLLEMARQYPDLPGVYANLGILYTQTDRDKEAQESFQRALELKPNFPAVLNHLAYLHRTQGRFELALKTYEQALKIDPAYADTHLNLGILYDLYLMEPVNALRQYQIYVDMARPPENDPVRKWVTDLSTRAEKTAQEPQQGN
ncbi:MAG: tetratricopeptide repeat protein [Pseudomonadota bacterium]